jgi:polysaccharide chain length determinant protein (PEP-CTERM system associated)
VTVPKNERIRIVQETMFAPRLLDQVVKSTLNQGIVTGSDQMEEEMTKLRKQVSLVAPASNYITISYSHEQPSTSFKVVNKITSLFIEESAQNKRAESKSAYTFIDEQVKSYKNQLVEAENKLKTFEAENVDGIDSQVNASIAKLRTTIDEIAIDIEAEEVRIAALEIQLANETRYASTNYNARVYRDRLAKLESQLDTLRLNYRDEHPDVIDMRLQIQDVKKTIVEVENASQNPEAGSGNLTGERNLNPIYEVLSGQLSEAKVNVQTKRHRLAANENRLQEQYQRRVRVAANQADLSELTRDYSVTKNIYEDLLERKERARISMTLDLAGQGVTYKILEPAVFPVLPTGIRFLHFVIAGPILGIMMPLAIIIALIFFDHRIKFSDQLNELFPGIVLAVLPEETVKFQNWRIITASLAGISIIYVGAAFSFRYLIT